MKRKLATGGVSESSARGGGADHCLALGLGEIRGRDQASGACRLLRGPLAVDEREIAGAGRFERGDSSDLDFSIALESEIQRLCQFSDAHAL